MAARVPHRCAGMFLRDDRHLCALFETADDEYRLLLPFLRDGFENGERTIIVVADDRSDHLARLREEGIDVDRRRRNRQLEVLASPETCLRDGRFSSNAMLDFIRETLEANRSLGFSRTRLVAHAELALSSFEGANDALIEYESRLNCLLSRYSDSVICAYNLSHVSAEIAVGVIRTHPLAIIGDVLRENPFFVGPDALLVERQERRGTRAARASLG